MDKKRKKTIESGAREFLEMLKPYILRWKREAAEKKRRKDLDEWIRANKKP